MPEELLRKYWPFFLGGGLLLWKYWPEIVEKLKPPPPPKPKMVRHGEEAKEVGVPVYDTIEEIPEGEKGVVPFSSPETGSTFMEVDEYRGHYIVQPIESEEVPPERKEAGIEYARRLIDKSHELGYQFTTNPDQLAELGAYDSYFRRGMEGVERVMDRLQDNVSLMESKIADYEARGLHEFADRCRQQLEASSRALEAYKRVIEREGWR